MGLFRHPPFFGETRRRSPPAAIISGQGKQRSIPRRILLCALVEEIAEGDSVAKLYAALLARSLIHGDPELMHEFGQQIAGSTESRRPTI
jgi:hypothetical protein